MRLRYGELSEAERVRREELCAGARAAFRIAESGALVEACQQLEGLDPRLSALLTPSTSDAPALLELCALEPAAWPLAELLLAQAPPHVALSLSLGRSAQPLSVALEAARQEHGLSLERASLRAGFGRGHLLELTLGIPGGNGGENEQNCAENLVRAVLGDRLFETWIGAVHVTPAPRFPSLRVLDVRAARNAGALRALRHRVRGELGIAPRLARRHTCLTTRGASVVDRRSRRRASRLDDARGGAGGCW
jgi:hypothetical protein